MGFSRLATYTSFSPPTVVSEKLDNLVHLLFALVLLFLFIFQQFAWLVFGQMIC